MGDSVDTSASRRPIIVQAAARYLDGDIGAFTVKALIAGVVALVVFVIGTQILASSIERTVQRTLDGVTGTVYSLPISNIS